MNINARSNHTGGELSTEQCGPSATVKTHSRQPGSGDLFELGRDSKKDGTLTDKSTDEKEKAVREVCELVSAWEFALIPI